MTTHPYLPAEPFPTAEHLEQAARIAAHRPGMRYAVVLTSHLPHHVSTSWGPFSNPVEAHAFADFVTKEIDPAQVVRLSSPASELLSWRDEVLNPSHRIMP